MRLPPRAGLPSPTLSLDCPTSLFPSPTLGQLLGESFINTHFLRGVGQNHVEGHTSTLRNIVPLSRSGAWHSDLVTKHIVLDYAIRMAAKASPPMPALVDNLQARGRYTFTRDEVTAAAGRSVVAVDAALRRLRGRGRLASPRRGFYVIVPVEYREAGCPPATWFIDDLMRFLGQPYYVALLSAAAIHGAAHQQPMLFQVMTDRPTRPAQAGRVRVSFHMSRSLAEVSVTSVQTETGTVPVSTPEVTALDLVRFAPAAGHLSNVATVLSELAERLDGSTLAGTTAAYATSDIQRLGYLLDRLGEEELAGHVRESLRGRRLRPVKLAPGRPPRGSALDERWRVIRNESVEVDR